MAALVTDIGVRAYTDALVADDTLKYIGIGTGTGQGVTATDLATDSGETRATGTVTAVTTNVANDTYQVVGTVTATGTAAITEVGVFDNASSGDMGIYGDFAAINVVSGDSITFTIQSLGDQG